MAHPGPSLESPLRTFRCLALLWWERTSSKGAMRAIVGSNLYCSLLNSKSPLICIVEKHRKDHKSRSLNYCFFHKSTGVVLRDALPASQRLCANGPFEDCQMRMFLKQRALPSANLCEAGLIAKCECFWSSRTDSSSSYLLLKIKQIFSSQNRQLFT